MIRRLSGQILIHSGSVCRPLYYLQMSADEEKGKRKAPIPKSDEEREEKLSKRQKVEIGEIKADNKTSEDTGTIDSKSDSTIPVEPESKLDMWMAPGNFESFIDTLDTKQLIKTYEVMRESVDRDPSPDLSNFSVYLCVFWQLSHQRNHMAILGAGKARKP